MKNKYELIKNMDAENLTVLLAKGGAEFSQSEKLYGRNPPCGFFRFGCEINRYSPVERKEMCTECIKEFLSECAGV